MGINNRDLKLMIPKRIVSQLLESAGIKIGCSDDSDIIVKDISFYTDVLYGGSLGFGDAYVAGKWESNHIDGRYPFFRTLPL